MTDKNREPGINLIIILLKTIQAGQKKAIKEEFNDKSCILDGDSNIQVRYRRYRNGEYTYNKYSFPIINPLEN